MRALLGFASQFCEMVVLKSRAWAGPEAAQHSSRRLRPVRGRRFRDLQDRAWERGGAHAFERSGSFWATNFT